MGGTNQRNSDPGWKRLLTGQLPLEAETAAFILVNLLDFLMTYYLLMYGEGGGRRFTEGNPVARFFIHSWGIKGMLGFKLGVVAFVCVLTQVIALKSLKKAAFVLKLGTIAVACVVGYSIALYFRGTP